MRRPKWHPPLDFSALLVSLFAFWRLCTTPQPAIALPNLKQLRFWLGAPFPLDLDLSVLSTLGGHGAATPSCVHVTVSTAREAVTGEMANAAPWPG